MKCHARLLLPQFIRTLYVFYRKKDASLSYLQNQTKDETVADGSLISEVKAIFESITWHPGTALATRQQKFSGKVPGVDKQSLA